MNRIAALFLAFLCGCQSTTHHTWNKPDPYIVVPYPSSYEVASGAVFEIKFVVYNTTTREVLVPDPKKLAVTFINIDSEDPLVHLYPFALHGPSPAPPRPEIPLPAGSSIESTLQHSLSGDGTFLISAWGYDQIMVPVRIKKDPNKS